MRRHAWNTLVLALLITSSTTTATFAQGESQTKPAAATAPSASGPRAEFLKELDNVEKKMVSLAEAMPQDKLTWRPMEGVRSVSEVYMHMAGSNFRLTQSLGIKPPTGVEGDPEKITDKAKVVETLKQSFTHLRQAATNTPDADWDKTMTVSGRSINVREAFFRQLLGLREHLGQSVAYARMNRVVPPWTAAREAQQPRRP
ncbi:MAG: DinB family protein [Pyrinomonadaceae bacterium]|nr:DinB family protein [Pyrinomonadaceae bacterium]